MSLCGVLSMLRIRLNCVGVFDVVSYDPNLQSGSTQMERYKVIVITYFLCSFKSFDMAGITTHIV